MMVNVMDMLQILIILSVFLPLLSGVFVGVFPSSDRFIGQFSVFSLGLSFLCAFVGCFLFAMQPEKVIDLAGYQWIDLNGFSCNFGLWIDGLSLSMLLMVSFVSFLIHIYSVAYMQDEIGFGRFFSLISLFTFAMYYLVMTNNLVGLFFGWESVSVFSYFLIGFYYYKDSASRANLKAFLINRFGDLGFCLGTCLLIYLLGEVQYHHLLPKFSLLSGQVISFGTFSLDAPMLVGILFFIGVMSKSAQMPLHIWLPDSMEGPTPVSALIHAATMVTSGVYLLCRFYGMVDQSFDVQNFIAFIGASGALWLGLLALCEYDIKRIIAYSTLSQLGYMVVAVGVGAYQVAMFHLITHAFFKSLLFMAAGSVILALHHEQDIRKMGGLWQFMPVTALCFFIGALALSGMPPFAGFYSKDLILSAVAYQSPNLVLGSYIYLACLLGFLVTPLYIFRLFWTVFFNRSRHGKSIIYESKFSIIFVLCVLALMSCCSGFFGLDFFVGNLNTVFYHFDSSSLPVQNMSAYLIHIVDEGLFRHALGSLGLYLSVFGVVLSWFLFVKYRFFVAKWSSSWSFLVYVLVNKYGFDWVNDRIIVPLFIWISRGFDVYGEQFLIDDTFEYRVACNINRASFKLSRIQTGLLNRYFVVMVVFLIAIIGINFFIVGY